MVEVHSLEEVTYWAKKGHLGSDSDPTHPGVTNLIVAFGTSPWPYTLSLARVHVAPNQKMCSIIEVHGVSQGTVSTERRDLRQLTIT